MLNFKGEKMIDLHIHTTASDGSFSPWEIMDKAEKLGLKAIAITDHESVDGIPEAMKAAEGKNIKVIPGVEIEAFVDIEGENTNTVIHILGYNVNWKNPEFNNALNEMITARTEVTRRMVALLANSGLDVGWDEVAAVAGNRRWIGINHILECMLKKGYFASRKQAMKGYLQYFVYGKIAYVPFPAVSAKEAINIIKEAGGIPVLAHPGLYHSDDLIPQLVKDGIKGIEVYYAGHIRKDISKFEELATKYGLITTGGSDYHGIFHEWELGLGEVKVPEYTVKKLLDLF